ncbi:MAG: hypothetical protein MHPSP_003378 [Paramarteilia canceri]
MHKCACFELSSKESFINSNSGPTSPNEEDALTNSSQNISCMCLIQPTLTRIKMKREIILKLIEKEYQIKEEEGIAALVCTILEVDLDLFKSLSAIPQLVNKTYNFKVNFHFF